MRAVYGLSLLHPFLCFSVREVLNESKALPAIALSSLQKALSSATIESRGITDFCLMGEQVGSESGCRCSMEDCPTDDGVSSSESI